MEKKALVTGGAGGIGSAICKALAQKGHHVFVHYCNSKERAQALAKEIGGTAVCANLQDEGDCFDLAKHVGPIDVLVNNAGMAQWGLFTDMTMNDFWAMASLNLGAAIYLSQLVLPHMIAQKSGVILNVSSIWGQVGASCEVLYSTTKAGLIGFTKALAKEVGPCNIRVNAIAPGAIDTKMLDTLGQETKAQIIEETPLGRLGQPEDIANLVAFLVSEQANFITGQVISPDGGFI